MAVGDRERSDVKLEQRAKWVKIRGRRFDNRPVYSDTADPTRRDIFAPNVSGQLPETARVRYKGRTYVADLDFRTGTKGQPIPVYTWNVSNRAGR